MRKLTINDLGLLTVEPEINRVVQVIEVSTDFNRFPDVPIREFPVYLVRAADNKPITLLGGSTARHIYVSGSGIVPTGMIDFESGDRVKIRWTDCVWLPEAMLEREAER